MSEPLHFGIVRAGAHFVAAIRGDVELSGLDD